MSICLKHIRLKLCLDAQQKIIFLQDILLIFCALVLKKKDRVVFLESHFCDPGMYTRVVIGVFLNSQNVELAKYISNILPAYNMFPATLSNCIITYIIRTFFNYHSLMQFSCYVQPYLFWYFKMCNLFFMGVVSGTIMSSYMAFLSTFK